MRGLAASSALGVALLAGSGVARAEDAPFGERAHTVIVLDNLAGAVHSETSPSGQQSSGFNYYGFFPFTPIARFGIHEFVAGGLSVGAGLIYSDNSTFIFGAGGTTLGIAPRVGYAFGFSPTLALWIRGGITYLHTAISGGGEQWQLSPGGEIFLVYTPVSHFGITVGPFGEFGVAGGECTGQNCSDRDYRQMYYGLTFGVLADF